MFLVSQKSNYDMCQGLSRLDFYRQALFFARLFAKLSTNATCGGLS